MLLSVSHNNQTKHRVLYLYGLLECVLVIALFYLFIFFLFSFYHYNVNIKI